MKTTAWILSALFWCAGPEQCFELETTPPNWTTFTAGPDKVRRWEKLYGTRQACLDDVRQRSVASPPAGTNVEPALYAVCVQAEHVYQDDAPADWWKRVKR